VITRFVCVLNYFLFFFVPCNFSATKRREYDTRCPFGEFGGLGFWIAYNWFCLTAMEGLWSVFGEFELAHYGVSREQMVLSICVGSAAALLVGSFLGVLSDLM
jgi:hypothetical protein